MPDIRVPRPTDPAKFIPIDFNIPRSLTYYDKADKVRHTFTHIRAVTPRNIAKSYGAIAEAVEWALEGWANGDPNKVTIYMRRGVGELESAFPFLLKQVQNEFPSFQFEVGKVHGHRAWKAKPVGSPASEWRVIMYGVALKEGGAARSNDFSDVHHIIFDEFIDDGSDPIAGEYIKFNHFYDTVDRLRETPVTTLLLANPPAVTAGVSNPFFQADGIRVDVRMPEMVKLAKSSTLYWFPLPGQFGPQVETKRQREVGDSDYGLMSKRGEFINAYGKNIGKRGAKAEPLCALKIGKVWHTVWVEGDAWFVDRKKTNAVIPNYAMSARDIGPGVVLFSKANDGITRAVKKAISSGVIAYEDTAHFDELLAVMTL